MNSTEPQTNRQHSHTTYINIICFFCFFTAGGLGTLFEEWGYWQNLSWSIANAAFITGCVLSGVQLADKKWIIPASGFALMAIAFIGIFTLIPANTQEKIQEVAKNVILILPGMIMISSYKLFPLWVRFIGLVACGPYILILILARTEVELISFQLCMGAGYFLVELTAVIWGIYFLKILRRERRK